MVGVCVCEQEEELDSHSRLQCPSAWRAVTWPAESHNTVCHEQWSGITTMSNNQLMTRGYPLTTPTSLCASSVLPQCCKMNVLRSFHWTLAQKSLFTITAMRWAMECNTSRLCVSVCVCVCGVGGWGVWWRWWGCECVLCVRKAFNSHAFLLKCLQEG